MRAFPAGVREREDALTYEDLFVAIANELPNLPGGALKLLIRLLASGIETGSCEVSASKYWLAARTGLSREGVTIAARQISHIIPAEPTPGVTTTFILPAQWFAPQRSLFAVDTRLETGRESPGNLAATSQLSRRPLANKPGDGSQETRRQSPTFQATVANKPGDLANFPGDSRQETRLVATQNQPLSGGAPDQIRSDQIGSLEPSVVLINQIAQIDKLKEEQVEDARTLASRLVGYAAAYGHGRIREQKPSERILARCLAIAPVDTLMKTLSLMAGKSVSCGEKYAWFVTVFLNRIHGIESKLVVQVFENVLQKKKAGRHTDPLYTEQLLQQTAAGIRTMG